MCTMDWAAPSLKTRITAQQALPSRLWGNGDRSSSSTAGRSRGDCANGIARGNAATDSSRTTDRRSRDWAPECPSPSRASGPRRSTARSKKALEWSSLDPSMAARRWRKPVTQRKRTVPSCTVSSPGAGVWRTRCMSRRIVPLRIDHGSPSCTSSASGVNEAAQRSMAHPAASTRPTPPSTARTKSRWMGSDRKQMPITSMARLAAWGLKTL
mmetsp:Transcript_1922/g.5670  ORF Transcript_1922/g.5670 Transcript_1922/m.5670 type:complete len:212 (+) Transcript_1922:902-1537(+)